MADKLPDPNDYTSLLKIHHSIRDDQSNFSSKFTKYDNFSKHIISTFEKENTNTNNNIQNIILNKKEDYSKFNANPNIPIDDKIKLYREKFNSISNNQPNLNNIYSSNDVNELKEKKKSIDLMIPSNITNLKNENINLIQNNSKKLEVLKMKLKYLKNLKK